MEKQLHIPRHLYELMLDQLQIAYPLEACGLMAGCNGRVQRLYAVDNILQSPVAYEMDPSQQLTAMLAIEEEGLQLTAIYHSHPSGPEVPSVTDIERASYPEAMNVIVSLLNRKRPTVRAFSIVEGQVDEILILVV